jgi:hypothetical protein
MKAAKIEGSLLLEKYLKAKYEVRKDRTKDEKEIMLKANTSLKYFEKG